MHEIQTPETTKPLTSLEIRGFMYIEFGGEGEIRILRFAEPLDTIIQGFQQD